MINQCYSNTNTNGEIFKRHNEYHLNRNDREKSDHGREFCSEATEKRGWDVQRWTMGKKYFPQDVMLLLAKLIRKSTVEGHVRRE